MPGTSKVAYVQEVPPTAEESAEGVARVIRVRCEPPHMTLDRRRPHRLIIHETILPIDSEGSIQQTRVYGARNNSWTPRELACTVGGHCTEVWLRAIGYAVQPDWRTE